MKVAELDVRSPTFEVFKLWRRLLSLGSKLDLDAPIRLSTVISSVNVWGGVGLVVVFNHVLINHLEALRRFGVDKEATSS